MGAVKGVNMPKTDGFRKKGTGNPVLVAKTEVDNFARGVNKK